MKKAKKLSRGSLIFVIFTIAIFGYQNCFQTSGFLAQITLDPIVDGSEVPADAGVLAQNQRSISDSVGSLSVYLNFGSQPSTEKKGVSEGVALSDCQAITQAQDLTSKSGAVLCT